MAASENNGKLQNHLVGTVFAGTASTDLTTNVVRRIAALTGEVTARLKAMLVAAGGA